MQICSTKPNESIVYRMKLQSRWIPCDNTWPAMPVGSSIHTLCLMIDYILMGLEYNLYSSFEYHYIYWYLEYLYGWLHTSWKTADKLNHPEQLSASGKASKKKGRRLRKEATERKEREVTIIHIRRLVSVGFHASFRRLLPWRESYRCHHLSTGVTSSASSTDLLPLLAS